MVDWCVHFFFSQYYTLYLKLSQSEALWEAHEVIDNPVCVRKNIRFWFNTQAVTATQVGVSACHWKGCLGESMKGIQINFRALRFKKLSQTGVSYFSKVQEWSYKNERRDSSKVSKALFFKPILLGKLPFF